MGVYPTSNALSVSEVARLSGLTKKSVYEYIRTGKIKSKYYFNRRIVLVSDLIKFLSNKHNRKAKLINMKSDGNDF